MTLEQENTALQVANEALEVENDTLKAHINSLREALGFIALRSKSHYECEVCADESLAKTPTQSLAEHDRKVIEDYEEANAHPPHRSCMCQICNEYFKDDHIVSNYTLPPIDNEGEVRMRYTVKEVNTILGVGFQINDGNEGKSLFVQYTFKDEAELACRRLNHANCN